MRASTKILFLGDKNLVPKVLSIKTEIDRIGEESTLVGTSTAMRGEKKRVDKGWAPKMLLAFTSSGRMLSGLACGRVEHE